jgi:hypothetical protein
MKPFLLALTIMALMFTLTIGLAIYLDVPAKTVPTKPVIIT